MTTLARFCCAAVLVAGAAACADDGAEGLPPALSVEGSAGRGGDVGTGGAGGTAGGGNAAGEAAGGTAGRAGSTTIGPGGQGGNRPSGGSGGSGGSGEAGANVGGGSSGGELPPGGPFYHVSCLTSLAGTDPSKVFRFAGKILALDSGQRFVYLRALPVGATALSQAQGLVQLGKTAGPAVDGDPVGFGSFTLPAAANPVSSTLVVITATQLRLVLNGPESRPCAELDGLITSPLMYDLASPSSVDTCLFDPVASETAPVSAVTAASRFVPCRP